MKTQLIFLFICLLFLSSCSSGYLNAGLGYDRGKFGQGTFNPKTQSGQGLNAEIGAIFLEKNMVGFNVGAAGYSDNFDGEPTFYYNIMYARLFPISDNRVNFALGGELGRAGFASLDNMLSMRLGLLYDIPLFQEEHFGIRISLLDRPQFLLRNKGYEFNNNLSFSIGLFF